MRKWGASVLRLATLHLKNVGMELNMVITINFIKNCLGDGQINKPLLPTHLESRATATNLAVDFIAT